MQIKYEDKTIEVKENTTICEALKDEIQASKYTVIGAIFNNKYVNLAYEMRKEGTVKLLTTATKEGIKIYHRTLIFILGKAIEKICPGKKLFVNYQLTNSMFCDIENFPITEEFILELTAEMKKIVDQDLPIELLKMNREEAGKFYEKYDTSKGRLQFDFEENKEIHMFFCEDYFNYCYGTLGHRTGLTPIFEIVKYNDGFLVRYPSSKNPEELPKLIETKKLAWALEEYEDIHRILDVGTVYKLNKLTEENKIKHLITLEEALHEKKIANIADDIAKKRNIKMILIAGPSSSGKTTFAQRLGIQLRINGIKPVTISVDNYFVERQDTPKDENGNMDFECIEAIDLELFNDHLKKLLDGEEIEMPEFDFHVGTKRYNGKKMKLADDEVLVIEGIHCLNDKLTRKHSKRTKIQSIYKCFNSSKYG